MTEKEFCDLENQIYRRIQNEKKERKLETKAYIEGMERGFDLMASAVRARLLEEKKQ